MFMDYVWIMKEFKEEEKNTEGGTFSRQGHIKLKLLLLGSNVENYATVKWNHICFFLLYNFTRILIYS